MKRSLSKKSSVGGKAPTPEGFKCGPARCAGATSAGAAFKYPPYISSELCRGDRLFFLALSSLLFASLTCLFAFEFA